MLFWICGRFLGAASAKILIISLRVAKLGFLRLNECPNRALEGIGYAVPVEGT